MTSTLEALADEASTATVTAMAGTPWWLSRLAVVDWVRRVRPEQAEPTYAALSQLRVDALAGGADAGPALAAAWRSRLLHLLEGEPGLVDPLRRLLDEGLAAGTPGQALAWVAEAEAGGVIREADRARALYYVDRSMRSGGPFRMLGEPTGDPAAGQPGDHEAAVAAGEAVEVYRRLAADDPGRYEPDLLRALMSQCHAVAWGGDEASVDAAEAAGTEALHLYRRLAGGASTGDEPRLAAMLLDLGRAVAELSRDEARTTYLTAAVELYRRVAGQDPARYRPGLADALHELYFALTSGERTDDALAAVGESVDIRRDLATTDPTGHGKGFASELEYLREALSEAGRHEQATVIGAELVRLYRQLCEIDRAQHEPGLASALNDRGQDLELAGRNDEALTARREAVVIYRRLTAEEPDSYRRYSFAPMLRNLGTLLWQADHRAEAIAVTEECVAVYRQLVADNDRYGEPLTQTVDELEQYRSAVGR